MSTKNQNQKQWSDELNTEMSTIKPDLGTVQQERKEPRFTYSTAEFDSFAKNGFSSPDIYSRSDKWIVRFLAQVDLEKCRDKKINYRILNMQRTRQIDHDSPKLEKKEWLVYTVDFLGNSWLGNPIAVRSWIEGKHSELSRNLITKMDSETGRINAFYVKGPTIQKYTIPFTKKKVDDILFGKHSFGEDSINITDSESVVYYAKLDGEIGIQTMRCGDYTYEQFVTPEWNRFVELTVRKGGPAARIMNAEQEGYIK